MSYSLVFFVTLILFASHVAQKLDRTVFENIMQKNLFTWKPNPAFVNGKLPADLAVLANSFDSESDLEFKDQYLLSHKPDKYPEIPKDFDARNKWPKCKDLIGVSLNQGNCTSSWAVVTVAVMNDRICIESDGDNVVELSAEDVVTCCYSCRTRFNTCAGGVGSPAWMFWIERGIVSGGAYDEESRGRVVKGCKPYSEYIFTEYRGPACDFTCTNTNYSIFYHDDKHYGKLAYKLYNNGEQIQLEIMTNGPVTSEIKIYTDFYVYGDGIYQHLNSSEYVGTSTIKILGWGVEGDVKYWLAMNCWGKKWGSSNGFFKIIRGQNECDIENDTRGGKTRKTLSDGEELIERRAAASRSAIKMIQLELLIIMYTFSLLFYV